MLELVEFLSDRTPKLDLDRMSLKILRQKGLGIDLGSSRSPHNLYKGGYRLHPLLMGYMRRF
jgi:hypothetical protein